MKFKIDKKIFFCFVIFFCIHKLNLYLHIIFFTFLHECAHIVLAKLLGFSIQRVELMPFGFFCNLNPKISDYNKKVLKSNMAELKKVFVAIIGPISNIAIIFFLVFLYNFMKFDNIDIMVYSNILICLFNCIPIFPLDGGRVFKSLLKLAFGNKKANKYMDNISRYVIIFLTIVSSLLILYLKNILILFILIYLWILVIVEHRYYVIKKMLYDVF